MFILDISRGLDDTRDLSELLAAELATRNSELISVIAGVAALETLLRAYGAQ
jgi:hypothetical protein